MRMIVTALALVFGALPAVAYDDPRALLAAIYAPYQNAGAPEQDPAQYYSERLKGLVSGHAAAATDKLLQSSEASAEAGPVAPALTFNPFINAQHALLMDLAIGEPVVIADKAMAAVSFHNFDQATLLSLSLVREADGWKVDDVASLGAGEHWLLSWLLQYDPFEVN
jgi:hypothetical protein